MTYGQIQTHNTKALVALYLEEARRLAPQTRSRRVLHSRTLVFPVTGTKTARYPRAILRRYLADHA